MLHERAVLMGLKIAVWSGQRLDQKVTDDVAVQHNAASGVGKYHKLLVSKEALDPVRKIANTGRQEFYTRTLAWGHEGVRMCPGELLLELTDNLRKQKIEFESRVEEFINNYPTYVNQAKMRMGSLWNDRDYPDASDIRSLCAWETSILPIPKVQDWTIKIMEEERQKLMSEAQEWMDETMKSANQQVWQRIHDVANSMHERLSAYDDSGEKVTGVFRDSLIENARSLARILPSLNLGDDQDLHDAANNLKQKLCSFDAETLRKDSGKRNAVATDAQKLAAQARKMELVYA